jgi:hypothetical protein
MRHSKKRKRMRFTALLFGVLFTANCLKAQNVTKDLTIFGQVKVLVGKEVTKPLEYVWIEIKELKNITLADSLGHFKLNIKRPGAYKINLRGIGYQNCDTTINLQPEDSLNIYIKVADCNINDTTAKHDIKKEKIQLLLVGGIVPTRLNNQNEFEKKYGLKYIDYGDQLPASLECLALYNRTIFEYLDSQFGKSWRLEVRPDVIGFQSH